MLCTSYGEIPAKNFAGDCRSLMLSPFYEGLFETRLTEDRQAIEEFKTTMGGARRGLSIHGSILSSGADLIVVDDPIKVEDAMSETLREKVNSLFYSSIDTRINRDTGAIVIIMQRLHHNDLCGFVQKNENWEVLALPALAEKNELHRVGTPYGPRFLERKKGEAIQPHRQSADSLRERQITRGSRTFDAQYQQKPHGAEGAIIEREWLVFYDANSKPQEFEAIIQSWDTGVKAGEHNSFSACTTWGIQNRNYYLLAVAHEQLDFRELKQRAIALAQEHPSRILIEGESLGRALFSEMENDYPVELISVGSASKAQRLIAHINVFEAGRVFIPREGEGIDAYIEELTTFPDSDFSDQVDSTTQALSYDLSNTSFHSWKETVRLLSDDPDAGRPKGKVKLRVLIGGGRFEYWDHSKPPIDIPEAGKIIEVDEEAAGRLLSGSWPPKVERVWD
ncbi:MAG: phage terminase large subunit [Rhizomicrobium sp.]